VNFLKWDRVTPWIRREHWFKDYWNCSHNFNIYTYGSRLD